MAQPNQTGDRGFRVAGTLALWWVVLGSAGCGPPSWSLASEPQSGSVTLLNEASSAELDFVAETSHQGRVEARVNLPGVAPSGPDSTPDVGVPTAESGTPPASDVLIVAELIVGDEHSLVTLPGSGGALSVACPSSRCAAEPAQLTLRKADGVDLGSRGVVVTWSVFAETFGEGESQPPEARALLSEGGS